MLCCDLPGRPIDSTLGSCSNVIRLRNHHLMPMIEKTSEKTAPTEQIVNHAFVVSVCKEKNECFVITIR